MNVLIIVDMQETSFTNSDKFDSDGVIERINLLSEHTRNHGGKIIFIQHDGTKEEGLLPFTKGWEILGKLIKKDTDVVVRKTINDSFHNTELSKILSNIDVEKLIIAGWATDFCVDSTVRTAVSLGFNVIVASDCHTVSNRPHLDAEKVIEHHNWIWKNLIVLENSIEVLPLSELCR